MSRVQQKKNKSILDIIRMKQNGEKISVLTCYDSAFGKILEKLAIDILLVGDSLGNVVLGHENTIPVTMADMIHHTKAVARSTRTPLLVADLPFFSVNISLEKSLENACALIQEGGATAVKIEGGKNVTKLISLLTESGIPVMGHLGLTPQKIHQLGGFKVQGKTDQARKQIKEDALALQEAGVFSLVLEAMPEDLAKEISESLHIPTIGIGAGRYTDGQVLVLHDLLGFDSSFKPKFLKRYLNMEEVVSKAVCEYIDEVKNGSFPDEENCY